MPPVTDLSSSTAADQRPVRATAPARDGSAPARDGSTPARSITPDAPQGTRTAPARTGVPARSGAPVRRARPDATPGRERGQGQWALGYKEPLNPNERMKKDDDGLHCRERIETVYRYTGFDSIDPSDLRGRFRWWGLYTQRAPGIDGGKTAILEPEQLEDKFFMLRVRIDGGMLTTAGLRTLGQVSVKYARDTADLTDRQNVQYHWIRIEDVADIWQQLESVGLSTTEACGDTPAHHARLAAGGYRRRRDHRRHPRNRGDPAPIHRPRGVLQFAAQVQDRHLGLAPAGRRA